MNLSLLYVKDEKKEKIRFHRKNICRMSYAVTNLTAIVRHITENISGSFCGMRPSMSRREQ